MIIKSWQKIDGVKERSNHSLSIESSHGSQWIHRFKLRKVDETLAVIHDLCSHAYLESPTYELLPTHDLQTRYEFLELGNRKILKSLRNNLPIHHSVPLVYLQKLKIQISI